MGRNRQLNHGTDIGRIIDPGQSLADAARTHHMAKAAEVWAAEQLGAATDLIEANHRDRGWDLVLPESRRTVDVKWSRWIPGAHIGRDGIGYPTLNLSTWKGIHRAMIYLLVCGESEADFTTYAWASGWAYLDELVRAPVMAGVHGRPYHALGFDYLHPLHLLR